MSLRGYIQRGETALHVDRRDFEVILGILSIRGVLGEGNTSSHEDTYQCTDDSHRLMPSFRKCENVQGVARRHRYKLRAVDTVAHGGRHNGSIGLEVPQRLSVMRIQAEQVAFRGRCEHDLS